jgi:signal transduction histidine kinase/ligand-binding sensor domain-containing protein/DNA-binding response OmpR family regulator
MAAGWRIRVLDMRNGLSNNNVVRVIVDKNDVVWAATEDGLYGFDGVNFTSYQQATNNLSAHALNCILDDPAEPWLWIGTQRGGLNRLNYKTRLIEHIPISPRNYGTASTGITQLFSDDENKIWVVNYEGGLDCYDHQTKRFTHYNKKNVKGLPDDKLLCGISLGNGLILVGHSESGLSLIDIRHRKAINYRHSTTNPNTINSNEVTSLLRDRQGRIWVGTAQGLDQMDMARGTFIHWKQWIWDNHRIYDIHQMEDGSLWIAAELAGVAVMRQEKLNDNINATPDMVFSDRLAPWSLPGKTVRSIAVDRFGNVWMGMYGQGLVFATTTMPVFGKIIYSRIPTPYNLTTKSVLSVCADNDGQIWVGTDGTGINLIANNGERDLHIHLLNGKAVQALAMAPDGSILMGCFYGGAFMKRRGTGNALTPLFPHQPDIDVRHIDCVDGRKIIFSTSSGLFIAEASQLGDDNKYIQYTPKISPLTRSTCCDKQGRIWIGTFNNGVEVLSAQMKPIAHIARVQKLTTNTINHVFCDRQGRVWVATDRELLCYSPNSLKQCKRYDTRDGMKSSCVRAIAQDRDGNIWVSTNLGISCLKKGEDKFINYDYTDNIPAGNFIAACVSHTSSGYLLFGSNNGLCYFNPRSVLAKVETPPVRVTSAFVYFMDGKRDSTFTLLGQDNLQLEYNQRTLRLYFGLRNFAYDGQVEFQYRLNDNEDEWIETAGNNILFNHLSPGNYKVEIRARIHNKLWSKATVFNINVRPPFWLSWWAKLTYFLISVLIIMAILRFYLHNEKLKLLYESEKKNHEKDLMLNAERTQFYTNIAHELRTPLTLVIGPLEELTHEVSASGKLGKRIRAIYHSAERLNELIGRLLELRKSAQHARKLHVSRGNIVEALEKLFTRYRELYKHSSINIEFHSSEEVIDMYFDKDVLTFIMDNLMSNAIKYTPNGVVTIGIEKCSVNGKDYVDIDVTDTGYGIEPEELPHIFERFYQGHGPHQTTGTGIGLAIVKSMVELHHGTINVESKVGVGSKFTFRLPCNDDYEEDEIYEEKPENSEGKADAKAISDSEASEKMNDKELPRLLIVEDNEEIGQYIADCLKTRFEIFTAPDGKKGVEIAFKVIPDIIISDIMMPNMSGIDLCKVLKNDLRTSHIPIILLTAKESAADKQEGYEAGADSYITKPFVKSLIESRIDNLIAQRERMIEILGKGSSQKGEDAKRKLLLSSINQIDREFLEKINHVIDENIDKEDIDVSSLAESLNMSHSTLYRKMKSLTGMSGNEYIRKRKMQFAEKLLLEGKYTIAEIGYRVGISSKSYFRKCFKEEFGMTPSEYLRKISDT